MPINQSIPVERFVGSYDNIREFVRASPGPFAVMNCICQQGKDLLDKPCKVSTDREHCLTFGSAAEAMVRRGDGRFITRDQMLEFLDRADREGLVLEPQNTQDPLFICCCCGCCCGVLTTAKKLPRPAEFFAANYYAEADSSACTECGTCATRCQMEAVVTDTGPTTVLVERCIGCGLCVTTCPSEAMRLVAKTDATAPPKDTARLYMRMPRALRHDRPRRCGGAADDRVEVLRPVVVRGARRAFGPITGRRRSAVPGRPRRCRPAA